MHLYLIDNKLLLLTPKHAMLYELEGCDVFDLTESLGLEPV
jgi:hypothetical protein